MLYDDRHLLWEQPCLVCGATLESLLDQVNDPIDEHTWYDQFESRPVTMFGDNVGVVVPDGRAVLLSDDRVDARVRQLLAGDDAIVPYAEANPLKGSGQRGADYVVLAADGTHIVDQIFADGMSLTGGLVRMAAAVDSDVSAPSPRSGFVAVYSRSTARLFVIGGTDAATEQPTGEIWQRGTSDDDTWVRMPVSGYTPSNVLAATYSYRDNHLWILDELNVGHHLALGRLSRVDAATGEAQVVGTWPRLKLFDKHWLMLDRDGSVLLFASSTHTRAHWVFKLDPEQGTLQGMRRAKGMLAVRPSVDVGGYSFLVQQSASKSPTVVRRSDLDLVPAPWQNLGGCL